MQEAYSPGPGGHLLPPNQNPNQNPNPNPQCSPGQLSLSPNLYEANNHSESIGNNSFSLNSSPAPLRAHFQSADNLLNSFDTSPIGATLNYFPTNGNPNNVSVNTPGSFDQLNFNSNNLPAADYAGMGVSVGFPEHPSFLQDMVQKETKNLLMINSVDNHFNKTLSILEHGDDGMGSFSNGDAGQLYISSSLPDQIELTSMLQVNRPPPSQPFRKRNLPSSFFRPFKKYFSRIESRNSVYDSSGQSSLYENNPYTQQQYTPPMNHQKKMNKKQYSQMGKRNTVEKLGAILGLQMQPQQTLYGIGKTFGSALDSLNETDNYENMSTVSLLGNANNTGGGNLTSDHTPGEVHRSASTTSLNEYFTPFQQLHAGTSASVSESNLNDLSSHLYLDEANVGGGLGFNNSQTNLSSSRVGGGDYNNNMYAKQYRNQNQHHHYAVSGCESDDNLGLSFTSLNGVQKRGAHSSKLKRKSSLTKDGHFSSYLQGNLDDFQIS